jgi:hypothetical protein
MSLQLMVYTSGLIDAGKSIAAREIVKMTVPFLRLIQFFSSFNLRAYRRGAAIGLFALFSGPQAAPVRVRRRDQRRRRL